MELLMTLCLGIFISSWLILILKSEYEDGFSTFLSITSILSLVLVVSFSGIYFQSKEYKIEQTSRCEWILDNQKEYITYGEPN